MAAIYKLQRNTTAYLSTFLKTQELNCLARVNDKLNFNLKNSMLDRKNKMKATELLSIVLNQPSCKIVQEWLENDKPFQTICYPTMG